MLPEPSVFINIGSPSFSIGFLRIACVTHFAGSNLLPKPLANKEQKP